MKAAKLNQEQKRLLRNFIRQIVAQPELVSSVLKFAIDTLSKEALKADKDRLKKLKATIKKYDSGPDLPLNT